MLGAWTHACIKTLCGVRPMQCCRWGSGHCIAAADNQIHQYRASTSWTSEGKSWPTERRRAKGAAKWERERERERERLFIERQRETVQKQRETVHRERLFRHRERNCSERETVQTDTERETVQRDRLRDCSHRERLFTQRESVQRMRERDGSD